MFDIATHLLHCSKNVKTSTHLYIHKTSTWDKFRLQINSASSKTTEGALGAVGYAFGIGPV